MFDVGRHTAPTAEFDRLLSVNVKGVMLCYKYAAIQMIKQGTGGRIIGALFILSETPTLCLLKVRAR